MSATPAGSLAITNSTFTYNGVGVQAGHLGSLTLAKNTFTRNMRFAGDIGFPLGNTLTFSANSGAGNAVNGFEPSGNLGNAVALPGTLGLPYTVNSEATLTLQASTVVKIDSSPSSGSGKCIHRRHLTGPRHS